MSISVKRPSGNYILIICSIIFTFGFHYAVFHFLYNTKILNLKAFEDAMHARFTIESVTKERVELERYDSPEEASVLKEIPEQILKDIPYAGPETQAPETKTDLTTKGLGDSTSSEIKNQLQKEMLEETKRLSSKESKLYKDSEKEKPLMNNDIEQVQVSKGRKININEINIFTDINNLSNMHTFDVKHDLNKEEHGETEVVDIASIPPNRIVPETVETELSKTPFEKDVETIAASEESTVIHKDKYKDFSTDVEIKFATFRYPGKEDGYFKITFAPKKESILPVIPKDILFVIDVSGSMHDSEIREVNEALSNCLGLVNKDDRFNVIVFSSLSNQLFTEFQEINKANINAAISFINYINLTAKSYLTDVYNVLIKTVRKIPESDRPCNLFLISDGKPTTGITDIRTIVEDLDLIHHPNISIFPLDIGGNGNKYFLDLLSFESRGVSWVGNDVNTGQMAFEEFMRNYKDPMILDIKVSYCNLDDGEIYPKILPNLCRGQKIEIYGRCDVNKKVALRIVGNTYLHARHGKTYDLAEIQTRELVITNTIPEHGSGGPEIAREWARRKVHYLVTQIAVKGRSEELIMDIEDLRQEFNVSIPYKTVYGKFWFVKFFKR